MYQRDTNRRITHKDPKPRVRKRVYLDIETYGLGGPFALGAYLADGMHDVEFVEDLDTFCHILFSRKFAGHELIAHNGGGYDYIYFLKWLHSHGYRVEEIPSGGRVVGLKVSKDKRVWHLKDSYAITGVSLAKFAQTFGMTQKLEFDHEAETFDPANPEHREYLRHDVLALKEAYEQLCNTLMDLFGILPSWTASGTAYNAWRTTLPENHVYYRISADAEAFIRQAYIGGYVSLTTVNRHTDVMGIDANSMYPSVMLHGVPSGGAYYTKFYVPDKPGFYRVICQTPEDIKFPIVGKRTKAGVMWAKGRFETYIDTETMKFAENYGYKFEIIEGYYFPFYSHPFNDFVRKCYQLRKDPNSAYAFIAKLLMNSLYGRFGAKKHLHKVIMNPTYEELVSCKLYPYLNEDTGEVVAYIEEGELDREYVMPHWAAWITAQARLMLIRTAYSVGEVIYTDTDSIYAPKAIMEKAIADGKIPIGNDLGQWKIQGVMEWFQPLGPKHYIGIGVDGIPLKRHKGIPHKLVSPQMHMLVADGQDIEVVITSTSSIRRFLKTGELVFQQKRKFSNIRNSLSWVKTESGKVEPVTLWEVST